MGITRVRVLGPLDVVRGGAHMPVGGERARRVLALVVARPGASVRIERLADVVWDGDPPSSWRNTVQSYLSRFRSELGLRIERRGDAYALDKSSCIVDADEFDQHRRAGAAARAVGRWDDAETELAHGLELWRGPAFEGLTELDVVAPLAAKLDEERISAVEALMEVQLATGSPDAALMTAQHAIDRPVGYERLSCLQATALYEAGRAAEAMRELATYRRRLADETGLLPSAAVAELERLIVEGRPTPVPRPTRELASLAPELEIVRRTPLRGRDSEVDAAMSAWDAAGRESCATLFIFGEGGAGKTRLAAEIAAAVHERGAAVRYGRATERLDTAYQVFAHAFRDVGPAQVEAVGDLRRELHPIVPHLVPESPAPGPLGDYGRQHRFHEALGRLVAATTSNGRLLLILDDLQWASPSTVAAIEHLAVVSRPAGVVICGLSRNDPPIRARPIVALGADLERRTDAWTRVLPNLDPAAVAAVFKERDLVLDGELTRSISRATGGNALFVTELAASTGSVNELRRRIEAGKMVVPTSVATLVGDRLGQLDDGGDLVRWAALIGTEFESSVLEAATGGAGVMTGLEKAERVGLIREVAAGSWEFCHGLTRDAVLQGIGPSKAAAGHAAIAAALEAVVLPSDTVGRRANHWCEAAPAGHLGQAVESSIAAARHRLGQLASDEARDHATRALDVIGRLCPRPDPVALAELHLLEAKACWQQLDHDGYSSAAELAFENAERANASDILVEAAILRGGLWAQGRFDRRAFDLHERALTLVGDDRSARARLLAEMAGMLAVQGAPPDETGHHPVADAQEALAIADEIGDDETWLHAASSLIIGMWSLPDAPARQLALAREMEGRDAPDSAFHAARWIATPSLELGDRDGFEAATRRLRDIDGRRNLDSYRAYGYQGFALSALLDGHFEDAGVHGARAVELANHHPNFTRVYEAQLFWSAIENDIVGTLEPAVRQGVDENSEMPAYHVMWGMALCHIGRVAEAGEVLDRLGGEEFTTVPRDILWSATIAGCAELATTVGAREHAAPLDRLLAPRSGQFVVTAGAGFVFGAVDRFRAMLACLLGRHEEAAEQFDRAAAAERELRSPPLEARSLAWKLMTVGDDAGHDRRRLAELCDRHHLPWAARMLDEHTGLR